MKLPRSHAWQHPTEDLPGPKDGAQDEAIILMGKWAAVIADRVRNPMAAILASKQLLEDKLRKESSDQDMRFTVEHFFAILTNRLHHLDDFVTELVAFADAAIIKPSWFPAALALSDLRVTLDEQFANSYELEAVFDPRIGQIYADRWRLEQMLCALCLNGIEAVAPECKPQLKISIEHETADHDCDGRRGWLFRIADNGCGIPEELAHQVRLPFFSTKEAASGLGLSVVSKLIGAHAGRLSLVQSIELGGTEAQLFFPEPNPTQRQR